MKTFTKIIFSVLLTGCLFMISCKDDENDSYMIAKRNAKKIEQYDINAAIFHSSTIESAGKAQTFQIQLPFIIFTDEKGNTTTLPLNNLLNITFIKSNYLVLYFE